MTFHNGKPVDADGERVVITTPQPNAMVPAALAARGNSLQIYDIAAMEAAEGDSAKIVGIDTYSGPYAITARTPDNLVLAPYQNHWEGAPPLKGVTVRVVPDEQARLAGVQGGEADMAFYPSTSAKLELAGNDDMHVLSSELALQSLLVEMNLNAGIFTDTNVRKAFTAATDYGAVATDLGNGQFAAATGHYPDTMSFAADNQVHDLDEANRLLDGAGWTVGSDRIREKDGRKLLVRFVTQAQSPETNDVAIAMKDLVARAGFCRSTPPKTPPP